MLKTRNLFRMIGGAFFTLCFVSFAGYALADTVHCGQGQYLPANTETCDYCPGGKYCSGGDYSTSSNDQGITGDIAAGHYCEGGGKNGYPWSGGSASGAPCGACTGTSQYSTGGATSCSTVSPGYHATGCDEDGDTCTGQASDPTITITWTGVDDSNPGTGFTKISANTYTSIVTLGGDITTPAAAVNANTLGQRFLGWKFENPNR